MDTHPEVDLDAARRFVATHGRLLDRHRLACTLGAGDEGGVDARAALHASLAAYRNPDGGFGWGLEPDLRDRTSQPAPALHAFEAWADAGAVPADGQAGALCDWLAAIGADGAVPFALPIEDRAGVAPFWAEADPTEPSLQITAIVVAQAWRVAAFAPEVADHPWLAAATDWCVAAARRLDEAPFALVLGFAVRAVSAAVAAGRPGAEEALAHLFAWVPADGVVPVVGGAEGEALRPLDLAPLPSDAARAHLDPAVVAGDLARLASAQADDGGWPLEWDTYSPAAALEWRGHLTANAVALLAANP